MNGRSHAMIIPRSADSSGDNHTFSPHSAIALDTAVNGSAKSLFKAFQA